MSNSISIRLATGQGHFGFTDGTTGKAYPAGAVVMHHEISEASAKALIAEGEAVQVVETFGFDLLAGLPATVFATREALEAAIGGF